MNNTVRNSIFLSTLLWLLIGPSAWSQALRWQQVQPLDDFGITATAVAPNGNVYVAGRLTQGSPGGISNAETGPSSTGYNAFVGKWDATRHRFAWVMEMGKEGKDEASALVVQENSIYVAGSFFNESEGFGHPLKAIGFPRDVFVTPMRRESKTCLWPN